jgi:hypothetical protein
LRNVNVSMCRPGDLAGSSIWQSAAAKRRQLDAGGQAMGIEDVRVVSVPVSDQDQAREFYVERLGFELVRDDDSLPALHWVQVAPPGGGS